MSIISPLDEDSDFVDCFILSSWDNLFGPLVEHVWCLDRKKADLVSRHDEDHEAFYTYLGRQSMDGDLFMDDNGPSEYQTKISVFSDSKVAIKSIVFSASPNRGSPTHFALTMVVSMEWLELFLLLRSAVEDAVQSLGKQCQVLLNALSKECFLHLSPLFDRTARHFHTLAITASSPVQPTISISLFANGIPVDVSFLSLAVTAMYQTMGNVVVIGRNEILVNCYVRTLLFFILKSEDRALVRCVDRDRNEFTPGAVVQGLLIDDEITNTDAYISTLWDDILMCSQPLTIVDVQNYRVLRTHPSYPKFRQRYLRAFTKDINPLSNRSRKGSSGATSVASAASSSSRRTDGGACKYWCC